MVDLTKHMKKGLVEQKPGQILAFAAYTNKIPDIIKFTIGEPDFNTPEHIKKRPKPASLTTIRTMRHLTGLQVCARRQLIF